MEKPFKWVSAIVSTDDVAPELNDLESKYLSVLEVTLHPISQTQCLILCKVQEGR
jgi:hypothetical protein